ncbi:MAG: hypothetical protein BRC25_01395, partial [Parcubacteria group bacterium SW_6_46_9]
MIKGKTGWLAKLILLPGLVLVLSVSLAAPQRANAQSIGSAAASGVASGLATCAAQIGGTIAGSSAGSFAASKAASAADLSSVPTFDPQTQSANLTNNITRTAREGCLDAIAYNVAKQVLNQLADSTLAWIESGFTEFGQEGNKAFVGNINNFLSNVGQQTFNRFLNEVGTGNSPIDQVCGAFNEDVLESVGRNYFQENPQPAGMSFDSDLLPETLDDSQADCGIGIGQDSLQAFIDGDFQEGGWEAFYHQVENPNASPVGAYLEQRDNLRQRIQQARNTNLEELRNNNGWISEVACPGNGDLDPNTNSCTDSNGNTLSEPTIRTPGNIVNETINNTIGSDQRRLELADEVNEIVGALADQLVSQVIGGGTGGGGDDATKGLFSKAAQDKSDALGNFAEAADSDSDYGNQLQEEYVRDTLNDQITLEKDLLTVVRKLPDTNDVSKLESRINRCLENTHNNSGGPSFADKKTAGQIEEQLTTLRSAYNSAFPAAESADEKEVGPQKIDWVGNDIDNWNYGDPQGLESCERWKDAFNVSYVPDRDTQSWEAYMCVHKNGSQFNEKSSEFASKWIAVPSYVTDYFSYGPEDAPGDRPLYRNARNNKIKIDWKGDDLDWEHYDPFAYEYSSWVPEDRVQLDDNEETHTGKVWMNKAPEQSVGVFDSVMEYYEDATSSSSTETVLATTTVEQILFQDSLSGHTDLPGPNIDDTEGEKFDLVPNKVGDTNRYGAKVCDERNLGAVSYVVKPHDTKWTIQRCNVAAHNIKADSGGFFDSVLGAVTYIVTGPAGAAVGYAID